MVIYAKNNAYSATEIHFFKFSLNFARMFAFNSCPTLASCVLSRIFDPTNVATSKYVLTKIEFFYLLFYWICNKNRATITNIYHLDSKFDLKRSKRKLEIKWKLEFKESEFLKYFGKETNFIGESQLKPTEKNTENFGMNIFICF